MKRVIIGLLNIILICIVIFLFLQLHSTKINKTWDGLLCSEDGSYKVKTSINIRGKYYKPILGHSKFSGNIEISGIDYTTKYSLCDFKFDNSVMNNCGILIYDETEDGIPQLKSLGLIWVSKSFSKIIIEITDERLMQMKIKNYMLLLLQFLGSRHSLL